ncbi:MAG: ABC transporter ATP-binding protein [Hyphomonadaceae bacterium]|nr:ABC transporter ATP-binding protein [Hyphomonadaceae bacterium]
MIEMRDVTVRLGGKTILDRVSLSVGDEVVALAGPSGCGKTTLLRVLLGLETPVDGEVWIGGQSVSARGRLLVLPEHRNIAMVFQDLALWPHLTARGNLAFGLKARSIPKDQRERRIAAALAWVGLDGKGDKRPGQLSGGERQRVAIARALVLDPHALLLDEPFASLDILLKHEIVNLLVRLFAERRLPTLCVTHDPRDAAFLAKRVIVLESGRIVQEGTLSELAEAPATPFVRAFAGCNRTFVPDQSA